MGELCKKIGPYKWMVCLPQIIGRVNHKSVMIRTVLQVNRKKVPEDLLPVFFFKMSDFFTGRDYLGVGRVPKTNNLDVTCPFDVQRLRKKRTIC
jgi:hypothetical protein